MAKSSAYRHVIVESFIPRDTSGRHGPVHIRPIPGQVFSSKLFVECSKRLVNTEKYSVGTKFKIFSKLTDRQGGTSFLYAYHGDPDIVVTDREAKAFVAGLKGGQI